MAKALRFFRPGDKSRYTAATVKKKCVACGKMIPQVALDCVFCSARQPVDDGQGTPASAATAEATPAPEPERQMPSMTKLTGMMQAVRLEDVMPVEKPAEPPPAEPPVEKPAETAKPAVEKPAEKPAQKPAEKPAAKPAKEPRPEQPAESSRPSPSPDGAMKGEPRDYTHAARVVMGLAGAACVILFLLPWHGVSSWQLLETLDGADFLRQLFYLTGGGVLVAAAILPVPLSFRAIVGAAVGALPVLFGTGGILPGWRGFVAALAVLGLPSTLLVRERSPARRMLVLVAVLAVIVNYLAPNDNVVPLVAVFQTMLSGDVGGFLFALLLLVPLVLAMLSLLGLLGRDLSDVGTLLALVSLAWAPAMIAVRGIFVNDGTQLYVAIGLLAASSAAAVALAQLLSPATTSRA
jgi:hypothetical protein